MITTITLNPMLDKTVHIDKLERGKIHRALKMEMAAGGKGINVSRQLKTLGVKTLATGFLGGEVGDLVAKLLQQEEIEHDFVRADVPTREGVTYLEADGTATAVFEPSLRVGLERVHALSVKFNEISPKSTWVVCSGSSPGYEADDLYYEAITLAHKSGVMSVLDSYGNAFKLALRAIPSMVKPNRQEFEQTIGVTLQTDADFVDALNQLLDLGIQYALITDGRNPCYAAVRGHYWKITPPRVQTVNPVGSGDAMVAGLLYGFSQGWKFERCLVFGVSAGAANAQKWAVANSQLQEILQAEQHVVVRRL